VYLVHNFTDSRAKIEFSTPSDDIIPEGNLLSLPQAQWQTGDNALFN
jgi:hypothetical protein